VLLRQTLSSRNVKVSDADQGYPLLHTLRNSSDDRDLQDKTSGKPVCVGKTYTMRYKSVYKADALNWALVVHGREQKMIRFRIGKILGPGTAPAKYLREISTRPFLLPHFSPGDKIENCPAQFLAVCWFVRVDFKVHRLRHGFSVSNALLSTHRSQRFICHNLDKIGEGNGSLKRPFVLVCFVAPHAPSG
jgi:hypothetical protein